MTICFPGCIANRQLTPITTPRLGEDMSGYASEPTSMSLLERARREDQQAWRQIVHLYGPLVLRWCRRSGLADEDASDVFQETFRAVSTNLSGFAPTKSIGSFRSWLRTIARTKVADYYRRKSRRPDAKGGTGAQMHFAELPEVLPDDEAETESENALVVQQAMELVRPEFDERNWKAFWQVAVEGRTAVEVALEFNVSPQTVRQANYRIRRRLRRVLQGLEEAGSAPHLRPG